MHKKIITTTQCVKVYLQRLCIFGRDGGNGGKDELRRVVALHKLHTPVKTTNGKRSSSKKFSIINLMMLNRLLVQHPCNSVTDLRC